MNIPRKCTRWQFNKNAEISFEIAGNVVKSECALCDLSFGGTRISLDGELPKDALLKANFNIPGKLFFYAEAWIMWHKAIQNRNIYGLYFSKLRDPDKEAIFKYVLSHFPEQVSNQWWQNLTKKKGGVDMEDKRIFARFKANFPVRFINLDKNTESLAQVEDVSAKGIGVYTKEEVKSHTPLEMWLEIPDKGEPLYARGEAVWSKQIEPNLYRIGVNLERADLMGVSRVLRVAKS